MFLDAELTLSLLHSCFCFCVVLCRRTKDRKDRPTIFRQCKIFASAGSCRYGDACKYAHVEGAKAGEDVSVQLAARAAAKEAAAGGAGAAEKKTEDAAAMQNE